MKKNMKEINKSAFSALNKLEIYEAERLFRLNVKEFPNSKTFHNLGVSYLLEGIQLKRRINIRNSSLLSLIYLRKSLKLSNFPQTNSALGYLYFWKRKFRKAAEYFEKSYLLGSDCTSAYNCGVCLYHAEDFIESSKWIEKSINEFHDEDGYAREVMYHTLAFSYAYQGMSEEVKKIINVCPLPETTQFKLLYLISDNSATNFLEEAILDTTFDFLTIAMIFDVISEIDAKRLCNVYNIFLSYMEDAYDRVKLKQKLKKIYCDERYRKKYIARTKEIRMISNQDFYLN